MKRKTVPLLCSVIYSLCFCFPAAILDLSAQNAIDPDQVLFVDFSLPTDSPSAQPLSSADVQLSMAGKSREIISLARIDPSEFNLSNPNSWLIINQIRGGQALVFLLDLNSLDQEFLEHSKLTIKRLLDATPQGAKRYTLATIDTKLRFLQFFTQDKNRILQDLEKVAPSRDRADYKTFIQSLANIFNIQYRQDRDQAMEEAIREANIFVDEIRNRAESAIEGLGSFSDFMAGLSGPKQVLLFSGGYPMRPGQTLQDILRIYNQGGSPGITPSQRSIRIGGGDNDVSPGDTAASAGQTSSGAGSGDLLSPDILSARMVSDKEAFLPEDIDRMASRLNRNQLIVHAFDARDVQADGLASSGISELPSQLVGRHNSSHITAGREFLNLITNPTGGKLISSREAISTELDNSERAHYLIAFKSDRKKREEEILSRIKVELKNASGDPNLLRIRTTPFKITPVGGDDFLMGAFQFPGYYHDFSATFDYGIEGKEITGTVHISPREIGFVRDGNNFLSRLEIFGILIDSQGNAVTGDKKYSFAKNFPLRMNLEQYQAFLARDSITAGASTAEIPPGKYTLTMVARQPQIGLVAASSMEVEID